MNANIKRWRGKSKGKRTMGKIYRKLRYGILPTEFDKLLLLQSGLCAICGQPEPLQVDHCHLTGKVRGLLCLLCNRDIGSLERLGGRLGAALLYLEQL